MTVEIINGADGGPLFKMYPDPGNAEDVNFMAQFAIGLTYSIFLVRLEVEGQWQMISVRQGKENAT